MTVDIEDSLVAKALTQFQVLLEDPTIATHLDKETIALLKDQPQMLLGWSFPDIDILEKIIKDAQHTAVTLATTASRLEKQAEGLVTATKKAAQEAAGAAVAEAIGDVKETIEFVQKGRDFMFNGPVHMAVKTTGTLVESVFSAEGAALEAKLTEIAKQVIDRVPFVPLISKMLVKAEDYEKGLNHVVRSLVALGEAAEGKVDLHKLPQKTISLSSLEEMVVFLLRFMWNHSLPGILISLVKTPTLPNLFDTVFPLPKNLPLNFIHVWLTEKGLDSDELEFRKQLIASLDQFVRDQQSIDVHLAIPTKANSKTGLNLLSELISVVFSLVGGFVFRHKNVPSLTIPKLHWTSPVINVKRPFDGAHVVSTGISRSVSFSVKSVVATVGRGAWEINAHNDALIEGGASALSSFIGTLIQSVLNDLFWSVEVREIYEHQKKGVLASWDAVSEGSGEKVFWGVSLRTNVIPKSIQDLLENEIAELENKYIPVSQKPAEILQVLQSYTAYMDAIRGYTDHHDSCDDETIKFDKSIKLPNVSVTYSCTPDPTREPVLRAYCHGKVSIMKLVQSDKSSERTYTCSFTENPPENAKIFVRSNWGQSASSVE